MRDRCGSIRVSIGSTGGHLGMLPGVALGALLGAAQPADALVINPSFEPSWTMGFMGGPAAPAAATTVVNNVIAEYEADFSNPVTITISFGWGDIQGTPVTSGGVANFPSQTPQYTLAQVTAQYTTAVSLQPTNTALATAFANVPATYPNPGGSTLFFVPDAEFKALTGAAQNTDPIDGFTGYATDLCSGATCPDFTGFVEHEVAHAMGRVDWAFQSGPVPNGVPPKLSPLDFFKFDCGTTTLDPRNNQTCFSIDGGVTNPGGRMFDTTSNSSDWTGAMADSYNFQVFPGASVSTTDILEMCGLGWNNCAVPEPSTLVLFGTALVMAGVVWRRQRFPMCS